MASTVLAFSWCTSLHSGPTHASWFTKAENSFRIRNITDKLTKFNFLVSFLTKESVCLVLDPGGAYLPPPPMENLYTILKECLLSSRQFTNFQKIEKLHQLDSRVQWFFKLTMLHVVLDRQNISKTISEKAFFFILWCFYLFSIFVLINFKIGSSERWNIFFLK